MEIIEYMAVDKNKPESYNWAHKLHRNPIS